MGESLKGQKEKLTKTLQEEKEALKGLLKKVSEDPRNEKSFPEDMIDAAADAIIKSSLKKMEEGLSKKQAIGESWKEVYETLTSGGLTKQARGGLIGINELTRGL
jgi:RNA polymerase-binding transcription factor DksA